MKNEVAMKKIIALTSTILFMLFFALSFFPETAFAADAVIDTSGTYDISLFDDGATVTINGGLSVTLTNTTNITLKDIYIVCIGANTHITANNVAVYALSGTALKFTGAGNTLTLIGSSYFKAESGGGGIIVNEGTELTINGEGSLEAYGDSGNAGIGGETDKNCGKITILGGTISASGYSNAAAIGGGENGSGGTILISGGSIEAKGGLTGAGIGGGKYGSGGNITIEGGSVTTRTGGNSDEAGCASIGGGYGAGGGTITITGGTVDAKASEGYFCGAAIGSGRGSTAGSEISISGGIITAAGRYSAGIGGGYSSAAGTIKIFGDAEVTAKGGSSGAGIGGGYGFGGGEIDIYGNAKVTATGGAGGAAIGGGHNSSAGTIKIYGDAEVNATGGSYSAGIGGGNGGTGGDIIISGGTVTATGGYYIFSDYPYGGAGIGGGSSGTGGNITISGGTVTSVGSKSAAGIGGGKNGNGGNINISGGTIEATGGLYSYSGFSYDGAGIGGGYQSSGGNITISGGTVTANGAEAAAGIGGGIEGAGGSVSIEGGTVFAAGNQGMDIGHGYNNTIEGTLSISGKGIVFFKHDSFPTPATSLNYFPLTSADANGKLYGVALPAGWNEASGYLYNLIKVSYNANGGSGSVPESEFCLSSDNCSFTADYGNDLTNSGQFLLKWNTVQEGTGIDCLRGVTYSVNSSVTLYAQWSKNVSSIMLDKHSLSTNIGDSSTITATVSPSDAYSNVCWLSSDTQVAVVDQNGKVTGKGNGTATITAASNGISDSCTVTVSEKPVTSVSLNYNKKYMNVGDYLALTAIILPDDASDAKVTWKSSNTSVATVTRGVVQAVGEGSCTIAATADGKSGSCTITVNHEPAITPAPVVVDSLKLTIDSNAVTLLYVGDSVNLVANVFPSNALNRSVSWHSSDESVATVSSLGHVSAVGIGEAKITAIASGISDIFNIAVQARDDESSLPSPTPSMAPALPDAQATPATELPNATQAYKSGTQQSNGISALAIVLIALGMLILGAGGALLFVRHVINKK